MKKHITDEKTGISYTLCGDYYLPDLELKEQEESHYGKYGMLRKSFLKEHRPGLYSSYLLTGKLTAHLNEVDQQANERMEVLVDQMMERQAITEELKVRDQMAWVGTVNNIQNAAEEIVFDTVTTGASNDIEKATKIARSMITQYGMSEKFGLIGLESIQNRYLDGRAVMNCGEATAAEIDQEVMEMLKKAYDEAKRLLTEHREALDKIAAFLIEKETITGKEFMKIFHEVEGIDPDAPKKTEERIGMKAVPEREKAVEEDPAAEETVEEDTPEEKTVTETSSVDVE